MINTTKNELVFNQSGKQLDASVCEALESAATWLQKAAHLEDIRLQEVTTKRYIGIAFAAYVRLYILKMPSTALGEQYVRDAFEVFHLPYAGIPEDFFYRVTFAEPGSALAYKKTYTFPVRRGLGVFLAALHACGAVTLPYSFSWPTSKVHGKNNAPTMELCDIDAIPELLRFMRRLDSQSDSQSESVFSSLLRKQRERLASVGTKLLLITGWLEPSDANYEDLLAIRDVNRKTGFAGLHNLPIIPLIDVLERRYGSGIALSVDEWKIRSTEGRLKNPFTDSASLSESRLGVQLRKLGDDSPSDDSILAAACDVSPSDLNPERLELLKGLPGLGVDLPSLASTWLTLENAYIRKIKRETYKPVLEALGYFNIYLFVYLSHWYERHPSSLPAFPSEPSTLTSGIFIVDLGLSDEIVKPCSLLLFLEHYGLRRAWQPSTHYGKLKQIEKFFDFLEQHGDSLPGCRGFRQPFSADDYPSLTRSSGTNKRPIPRRIFSFMLLYVEALITHTEALINRVLSSDISSDVLVGFGSSVTVIDTFAMQDAFGFVPVVFYRGKAIPLRRIPNTIQFERMRLKDGRILRLPQPHSLNQILVVLHTGLRNNHVQWLDADSFDKYFEQEHHEFTRLYVNTDKVKDTGWAPHVHVRVVEVLRNQLQWRLLIGEPGFAQKVHYNNNERSKWGSFYPLFSAAPDGSPHSDDRYTKVWMQLLSGVQAMLPAIGEPDLCLCRLLPSGIPYGGIDIDDKLREYGRNQQRVCNVHIKSNITPHSARVSVVSHLIAILPADVIGRCITGQTSAIVGHYVVLDDDEVHREQQLQNLSLRQTGYDEGYDAMLSGDRSDQRFIKPDEVNSRLAQSMRANLDEAVAAYGFTCLSLYENIKTGLDILRETRCQGAVFNKTEICPYGNQCPQDLAKQLGGSRRCGICHYAVRSIDHLPAVTAKGRQVMEMFSEIELKLDAEDVEVTHTPDEIDLLEAERGRLAEDLTAWQLVEDVLEMTRQRIASGASNKKWVVQKPEIIEQHLKRALFPSRETEYLLARMRESVAYPMLESPQIRARSDILRRQLLANTGRIREAFNPQIPENPAAECLGLIRSVVAANKLSYQDLLDMLETDKHLDAIPRQAPRLLTVEEA